MQQGQAVPEAPMEPALLEEPVAREALVVQAGLLMEED